MTGRESLFGGTALAALMLVTACRTPKGGGDAGAEGGFLELVDAAPIPGPAILATNQGDIARFPDETQIANLRSAFLRPFNVREAPPAGVVILGLPKGAVVTQIASRSTYFLIVFDNPKVAGTQLMGWVSKDAFSANVPDAGVLNTCPPGEVALMGDSPFCGRSCATDGDCSAGQGCRGSANKIVNGKAADAVKVCTVSAPTPAGADAAVPALVDSAGAHVEAGSPSTTGPVQDVVAAAAGKCPANFVLVTKTGKCHRPCTTSTSKTECRNNPYFCEKCDADFKHVCTDSNTQCK